MKKYTQQECYDEFVSVLEFLYSNLHLDIDYEEFRKAIEQGDLIVDSQKSLYTELTKVCATLGVQIYKMPIRIEQIFTTKNKNEPWLFFNDRPGKFNGWLGISEVYGRKAKVHFLTSGVTKWISLSKIRKIIGEEKVSLGKTWLAASSGLPLSPLESRYHKKALSPQRRLFQFLKIEKNDLYAVFIYSLVAGFFYLVTPIVVQTLVNTIAFGTLLQPLLILTIALFFILAFAAIIGTLNSYVVELIQQRLFAKLACDLSYRLPRVKFSSFDRHNPPELVNRFFDIVTVQKSASSLVIDGLSIVLQTIIGMIFLMLYHPILLIFNVVLLASICYVLFALGYGAIRTSVKESYAKYDVVGWLQDIVRNRIVFKSQGGLNYLSKQSDAYTRNYLKARKNHFRILLWQIIGFFGVQAFANAAVLGFGGYLVIQGELSLGQLVAAEIIIALITLNLTKFSKHLAVYYDLVAATDKLGYLIDLSMERNNGDFINIDKPIEVKVKNLTFSYKTNTVLRNAEMVIPQGKMVGLVGKTGSGKSTLLEVLYGLRTQSSGRVLFNNVDNRYFFLPNLRAHLSLSRGQELFAGTIRENICLDRPLEISKINDVLYELGILDFIQKMPDGLETKVTSLGNPLSQGLTYCIVIARAVLSGARLIIIDQLLDSIDGDLRKKIADYLKSCCEEGLFTVLISAYNLDSLQDCDLVYEIVDEKIQLIEGKNG
ncbi:peptidase domain-containing ABC transporter [Candidatus Uabimicrobium amorphum]|uniref:ABC transporter ATP-binding protein n=1 Tax=Uabimicrobium amorphum TaxID=2596890 RepID=A0A5S9IKE1_UABAM|nr:ABC transporter transmembrane domain-containing protein [Candidatus Uabimicrobium amorphum]BBM83488.1 ABC transporter ATP-binding protein [Candidatus Uabimicrobium amorphum]